MSEETAVGEYPKELYHPNGSRKQVENAEEETASEAEGYVDSPLKYNVETCPAAPADSPGGFPAPGFPAPQAAVVAGVAVPVGTPAEASAEVASLEAEAESRSGSRRRSHE